mgnify:CR=1 FL=1
MTDIVRRAAAYAETKHAGQARKDRARSPYIGHPAEVAGLVAGFGGTPAAIAAAWLHDTVEDCPPTTLADIEAAFGAHVATLVGELTDDKSLAKAAEEQKKAENSPRTHSRCPSKVKVFRRTGAGDFTPPSPQSETT